MYDEEKSIDKILEGRSSIDKALEEYTKHKNDKETVPGNNKPEDNPTPDNKPNNNSSNNGTVDNTKPSDNSNSSTANDNANNSSNNTNNSSTEVKPGNNENTGSNKPENKPTPDNKPNNNSDNNGTVDNTKPSDNSNSSTEVKPGNNDNTGNNKPVDKPTPDNKPNNNSNAGNTNTNNNETPSEDIINNIFSNDASGVKVTLTDKTTAAKLSATPVEDKALANSVLEKLNLPADNQIRILDLKLLDKNNKVVNSNAKRTVAIVLKEDEKDVAVYHIKENGELELMKSKIKDGKVTFEIDHFSKFAIVSNNPKQNNGNSGNTSINNNTSNSANNHDATHNDSNVDNTPTLGHNDSNNKQTSPKVQNNQPTQIAPLNSSVLSSISNSKSGKHLAKTGLSNNNLASLAAIGLVLSGALIFGRRKNRK